MNPGLIFRLRPFVLILAAAALVSSLAFAQQTQSPPPTHSAPPQTTAGPFRSDVTLVPVRVVVRDPSGAAVPNLTQEDFQLLQDGKPQSIVHFSVTTTSSESVEPTPAAPANVNIATAAPPPLALPSRYIVMVFDDAHLENADLLHAKLAAEKFLDAPIPPSTRIAVLTTSNLDHQDFTNDPAALRKTIESLVPHPVDTENDNALGQCPPMTYYEADLIVNQNDHPAMEMATADTIICQADQSAVNAYTQVISTAHQLLASGEANTQNTIRRLDSIINALAKVPGQRNVLFVSSGFLTLMAQTQIDELTDRAARAGIVINTLDARGVFATTPLPQNNNPGAPTYTESRSTGLAITYRINAAIAQDEPMRIFAQDTGGYAFISNNDLNLGFDRTVGHNETAYLIAFAPTNLKNDGKFHKLQVKLKSPKNYTIEARRGFFAPRSDRTAADSVREEIQNAAYSQQDIPGIPFDLDLRYAYDQSGNAKLFATTHVNATGAPFETRDDGQHNYNFTIVTALFDANGIYIEGNQKAVDFHLKDPSADRLSQGAAVRSSFDVKQAPYFVRIVVRNDKDGSLAAKTGSIRIAGQPAPSVASADVAANSAAAPADSLSKSEKKAAKKAAAKLKESNLVWNPPSTDSPAIAPADVNSAAPCPVADVISAAAHRASELSANLERFDALETTAFESLDEYGVSRVFMPASFDYTVSFDRKPGLFRILESRTPTADSKGDLSAVQDSGVPVVALIFHPYFSVDFEMHCDGATEWNGKPAWLVRFHQIPGRPSRILAFYTHEAVYRPKLKGRAWIAQDSGQVLHLETNLEEGIPMMGLLGSAISVDYAPVQFHSQQVELWLPQRATTFSEFKNHRAIMQHAYSSFQLFSVQSSGTVAPPRSDEPAAPPPTQPHTRNP